MSLVLPDVSITTGPQWATLLNAAYTLIDTHDHSTGKGIKVTPAGLNISSDLSFGSNNATNLRTARLFNNSSISLGVNDKTCLYSLNNELYYVDGSGNNVQVTSGGTLNLSGGVTSLTLNDSTFLIQYFGDTSRKFRFDASSIPASTTRVFTVPNSGGNDTLVTQTATQTLTNKTLTAAILSGGTAATLISGAGTLTLPTTGNVTVPNGTDTLVNLAGVQTLTNKVLTGNFMASFSPDAGTHTLTAPAVTDTLATLASSQTFTNKVLSGNTAATLINGSGTVTLNTTGNMTLPDATDTVVGKATTDTLTNKTLTSPVVNSATLNTPILPTFEDITKTTVPASPSSGNVRIYVSSVDGLLHFVTSAGVDTAVGTGTSSTAAATTTTAGTITREGVWTAYTPTITGLGTVTNQSVFYKVLGDSLFVRGRGTTGTPTAVLATIPIPGGFTISNTKIPTNTSGNNGPVIGIHAMQNAADTSGYMVTAVTTSTSAVYFGNAVNGLNALTPQLGNGVYAPSRDFSFNFEVPLV